MIPRGRVACQVVAVGSLVNTLRYARRSPPRPVETGARRVCAGVREEKEDAGAGDPVLRTRGFENTRLGEPRARASETWTRPRRPGPCEPRFADTPESTARRGRRPCRRAGGEIASSGSATPTDAGASVTASVTNVGRVASPREEPGARPHPVRAANVGASPYADSGPVVPEPPAPQGVPGADSAASLRPAAARNRDCSRNGAALLESRIESCALSGFTRRLRFRSAQSSPALRNGKRPSKAQSSS